MMAVSPSLFIKSYKKFRRIIQRIGFVEYLLFAFLLLIIYFVHSYFSQTYNWFYVEMKIDGTVPYWKLSSLKKGDQEFNSFGQPIGEIVNINSYETNGIGQETYLLTRLKVQYNKSQKTYAYESKDLNIGSNAQIKPNGVLLSGIITSIDETPRIWEKVHKKILTEVEGETGAIAGLKPWLADMVKIGDEMKDANGEVIAKVLEKKVAPAKRITQDINGVPRLYNDPYLVNLYLSLDLLTTKENGLFYFRNNQKVKITNKITFVTDKYDLTPVIVDILE